MGRTDGRAYASASGRADDKLLLETSASLTAPIATSMIIYRAIVEITRRKRENAKCRELKIVASSAHARVCKCQQIRSLEKKERNNPA